MDIITIILILIIVSLVAYIYYGVKPKYVETIHFIAVTQVKSEKNVKEILNVIETAQFVPIDGHKNKVYLMKDGKIIGFIMFKDKEWYAQLKVGTTSDGSPKWDELHSSETDKESCDRICEKIKTVI